MNDKEAYFAKLVKEQKSTIYTVCYMFSHDEDEVNDLFQETLINLWKGIDGFREESKVGTWIYRVALNTCLLQERKKKKEVPKVPLTMDANFFEDDDPESKQIRQLHHAGDGQVNVRRFSPFREFIIQLAPGNGNGIAQRFKKLLCKRFISPILEG